MKKHTLLNSAIKTIPMTIEKKGLITSENILQKYRENEHEKIKVRSALQETRKIRK